MSDLDHRNEIPYITSDGSTVMVTPKVDVYASHNNLCFYLEVSDDEAEEILPVCDITVNIDELPYLFATIDTNNNGPQVIDFLEQNGFGKHTDALLSSGLCLYPIFRFDEDKLIEIDPEGFQAYAATHSIKIKGRQTLDDKICAAQKQSKRAGQYWTYSLPTR